MVGIADLKRLTDNLKNCQMTVKNKYCYFQLSGLNTYEFLDILNYKSWLYKTYQKNVTVRYVNIIKKLERGNAILRTSIGFGPLLLRLLRSMKFPIRDQDIEAYRARNVVFPDLKINLYDFQDRMINDWWNVGGIGVVKSPTGSGKTIVGCRAIKQVGRKTLILVHTSDLLINVWNDSLIKTFGPGIMSQVGIIGGGLTDSDRMAMKIGVRSGDFEENVKKDIVIATFQTLNNRIDMLSQYKFGLMIVDECIPIDSDIWTNDGVVKYEDLGYGPEYKNDIFQVWSADNNNNVVNNGYKKIKTRMKHMYRTIVETGDELVCSLDHKVLTIKDDGKEEFVEIEKAKNIARSLIKPYDMRKESILARIFGYVLGDGHIGVDKGIYKGAVSGDFIDLERVSQDIKKLNYFLSTGDSCKISEIHSDSIISTVLYGDKHVSGIGYGMGLTTRLSEKLVELGFPVGKKTDIVFYIPEWIMNGDIDLKREFLAAYLGAEATNSTFRGDEKNKLKKSFYVPRFSISKRSDLVKDGLKLIEQFKKLFAEFGVNISSVSVTDSNIRKDGTISKELRVTIGNQVDNLRRYFEIGYRYCREKEINGELIRLYLKYIGECDNERKEIQKKVLDLYDKDIKHRARIVAIVNSSRTSSQKNIMSSWGIEEEDNKIINKKVLVRTTDGMVSDILYPHKRNNKEVIAKTAKVKEGMYSFDDWLNKIKGDFIFLDIVRHEYRGYEQGYTLTVDKDHNYLVNGFDVANCHHVPAAMFRKVNAAIRAPYKMGLSATVRRLDGLEKDVYGSLGDIQTSVSIRELINKGILAEPRFQSPVIVDHGAIDAIESCGHAGLVFSRFVKKTSASSTKKKDYIINICKNIAARDRKFLLFTDYVHAEDVYVRDMYADSLLKEGMRVSVIDQGMSTEERSAVFGFLETGDISGIIFGKLGSEGVNIPSVDVVIMANAIKCVSGDILIPTNRGIIRAEDLDNVKPNIVSTMDLEDRSIVRANINELYNFDEEDTIRIMTGNGYEIEGSLSHMVIVKDNKDNLLYKSLYDICVDDEVIICGSNIYGEDICLNYVPPLDKYVFSIIDRINNSDLTYKIGGFKYKYVKIYYEELKKIFNPDKRMSPQSLQERVRYRFGKRGVSVSRPRYDEYSDKWFYTFDNSYQSVFLIHEELRKDVIVPKYVTKDLAELLGYIVSEGYIDSYYNIIEIVNLNNYMAERLMYLFKSLFDYDVSISILEDRNNIRRVRCHSKTILEFFNYLDIEHRSGSKVVPWCILRSSKDVQLTFLRSLFVGDGGTTNRNNIVYGSVSKRLCDEVHIMLLNMGIISKKNYNGVSWSVLISSAEADKFMKDIGFSDNREFEYDIDGHNHKRLSISHYKDGNVVFFDNVVSKVSGKNKLYDMNIDKYHSFIGGGFMNHNSPITFTQRVGRVMRKVPGKDFCDVYEILLDVATEYKWSDFNFAEYKMEGFQKLVYKVE